jgi:hypothetical protein
MHSHQHLLLGGACLHLVARPAHHDRHFMKTVPAPFPLSYITASLSRPQAPTAIDAHGNWPEHVGIPKIELPVFVPCPWVIDGASPERRFSHAASTAEERLPSVKNHSSSVVMQIP